MTFCTRRKIYKMKENQKRPAAYFTAGKAASIRRIVAAQSLLIPRFHIGRVDRLGFG